MKKLFICTCIAALVIISSCTKPEDFLATQPLNEYSSVDLWNSPQLIETFINGMYLDLLGWPFNFKGVGLSTFSGDEAWFNEGLGTAEFNKSLITPDNLHGWVDNVYHAANYTERLLWKNQFKLVRNVNLFFENIGTASFTDQELKDKLIGEVYFIRGATYHYLTAIYGGVPIVKKAYVLTDNFSVPRNTYEECINFIEGQLDSAAMYLPEVNKPGLATKGAALALKSRVLLYAASDLHHNMSSYSSDYTNPELLGYVNADRTAMWQKAKDAAKAVIDLGIYSLYKGNPTTSENVTQNIKDYFLSRTATCEDIFVQYFLPESKGVGFGDHHPYMLLFPNGYNGWGGCQPFAEMVDDYEMADGTRFDWSNPVHKVAPYSNREPRFYASILYEGADFAQRPGGVISIDPYNQIQTGRVNYVNSGGENKTLRGADAGLIDDWSAGVYTGYFYRKTFDPDFDYLKEKQDVPWRHMRYAEILLNYAEACIELGQEGEARNYINMVRTRAGLPDISGSGNELQQLYRHERRIELAFEDHRFFDVRRWIIGSSAYHPVHKVVIEYTTDQNITNYRKPDGSYWSVPSYSTELLDDWDWHNKMYFFPISRDELYKNDQLAQNPNY